MKVDGNDLPVVEGVIGQGQWRRAGGSRCVVAEERGRRVGGVQVDVVGQAIAIGIAPRPGEAGVDQHIQDTIGWQLVGSADGFDSDEIWCWDAAGAEYQKNWLYDSGVPSPYDGTWFDAEMAIPTSDVLGRGQGWWYMAYPDGAKAGSPSWMWEEPVPY